MDLKYKILFLTLRDLQTSVNEAVRDGYRPIVMKEITLQRLEVYLSIIRKEIGVIWIDIHGDMNTDESTITGNIHGMPLALYKEQDRDLVNCFYEELKLTAKMQLYLVLEIWTQRKRDNRSTWSKSYIS